MPRSCPNHELPFHSPGKVRVTDNSSIQKPRMEFGRQERLRPHFNGGASVLANPSDEECDVVLLLVWIELANVGDNRVNQT
jgi:hypothetical protein